MAEYARPGGQARWMRSQGEQGRRLRTKRPLNWHVPGPTWAILGAVPVATMPALFVPMDPTSGGDYPEFKQIVGFTGRIESGSVEISWWYEEDIIYPVHVITAAGPNFVTLDTPYIISGEDVGEWIFPEVVESNGGVTLSAAVVFEEDPV